MIEWFSNIFASPSDKAKLVAILISATVAIAILILNQWFTNRRERKKIIVEKIEEMYINSIDYTNSANQLIKDLSNPNNRDSKGCFVVDQVVYGNMNDAIRRMQMLCGLYFSEINFQVSDYSIANLPIVDVSIKGKNIEEGEAFELYQQSREHINNAEKKLSDICRDLMKSKMI